MKSFYQFISFCKLSLEEVIRDKKLYLPSFFILIFLSNLTSVFPFLGISEESTQEIALTVGIQVLISIVFANIVLIQKRLQGHDDELLYFAPTFLLNNLYYSFASLVGFIFFLVPGFLAYLYFSFVPFIAVLDLSGEGKYFQKSKNLVKKNVALVGWAVSILLITEMMSLIFNLINDLKLRLIFNFLFSFPEAFLSIILTITFVKIYYFLNENQEMCPAAHNNTHDLKNQN